MATPFGRAVIQVTRFPLTWLPIRVDRKLDCSMSLDGSGGV
jgi:hypothetical protein